MRIPRRDFVKLLGVSAGALGAGGCGREWLVPDRLVERALRGPGLETHLQSVCGLCETGCGLTVRLVDGLPVGLKGNPQHPLNRGGLCPVGQAALDVLYAPERLQAPLRRAGDGRHTTTTWAEALDEIASRLSELHARQAAERIALISEEPGELFAGLAERFARALGTPNLAPRRGLAALPFSLSQGLDVIPGFDLAQSDLVLSFGLDLYEDGAAPLHAISALVGVRPDETRATLLHVGTRLSPSAAKAEQRIAIRPGTHAAFALGVAQVLVREGRCDTRFLAEHTHGFEDWNDGAGRRRLGFRRLLIERYYPDRAAQLCGCDPTQIVRTARRFAEASAPLALVGGEVLRASNASWTAVAVHALNALVGAFDRPGGVVLPAPVPLAPLPPLAEPGGAAARRSVFAADGSGGSLGIDPIEALAERVLDGSHPIDVLFVVGANPVHDSPAGPRLREALERIPLVVSLTPFRDETAACADLVLPSHVFLEGWQGTTTPATVAFSVVGLSHPVVEPLYDTRHPADVLLELGRRVAGTGALPWESYADYLKDRLQGVMAAGQGSVISDSFETSWIHFLEERGWRFLEEQHREDFWSGLEREAGWWDPVRVRGDWARLFRTPSGRFEFFSTSLERKLRELGAAGDTEVGDEEALRRGIAALRLEAQGDEACLPHYEPPRESGAGDLLLVPFRPITARGRQGHSSSMVMEMFGFPVLSGWQTWAEIAAETAHELGLEHGDRVAVESDRGAVEAVVRVQPGAVPGVVHMPEGLGHAGPNGGAEQAGSNPLDVVVPLRDSLAGTLTTGSTRVQLRLVRRRPHGGPAPAHGGNGA